MHSFLVFVVILELLCSRCSRLGCLLQFLVGFCKIDVDNFRPQAAEDATVQLQENLPVTQPRLTAG